MKNTFWIIQDRGYDPYITPFVPRTIEGDFYPGNRVGFEALPKYIMDCIEADTWDTFTTRSEVRYRDISPYSVCAAVFRVTPTTIVIGDKMTNIEPPDFGQPFTEFYRFQKAPLSFTKEKVLKETMKELFEQNEETVFKDYKRAVAHPDYPKKWAYVEFTIKEIYQFTERLEWNISQTGGELS